MVRVGLVSIAFKSYSVDDVLRFSRKANVKGIEWSENHHIPVGDIAFAQETARKTSDLGIGLAGYGSYYRLGQGMSIVPSLETASAMGASQVRIWAGFKPSAEVCGNDRASLMQELSAAVETAKAYNIILNVEWHKNTLTDTNESAIKMLSEIDDPALRTLWQPTDSLTFAQRVEGLKMVMPYLSYLHVYYRDETGRRTFNEGLGQWREYLAMLDGKKDYFALIESVKDDSVEQFYEDIKALEGLVEGE